MRSRETKSMIIMVTEFLERFKLVEPARMKRYISIVAIAACFLAGCILGASLSWLRQEPDFGISVKPAYPSPILLPDALPAFVQRTTHFKGGQPSETTVVAAADTYRSLFKFGWDREWEAHCDLVTELRERRSFRGRWNALQNFATSEDEANEISRALGKWHDNGMTVYDNKCVANAKNDGILALRQYLKLSHK